MLNKRAAIGLVAILVLSLAVNLFLLGEFAGRASFLPQASTATAPAVRLGIVARYRTLPQADRARFRAAMMQEGQGLGEAQRTLRGAQAAVLAALRATPYDKRAMLDAFAALRVATTARQVALQSALADAFATLPQADRDILAGPAQP